jgi:hypothetical protein
MAKSDLLKEAIADARTVKETALANAKIALQEAFAPRLENMLAARLQEELDDEEAPMGDEELSDEEAPMGDEPMGDEEMSDFPQSVDVGLDFDADGEYDLSGTVGALEDEEEDMMMDDEMAAAPEDEYEDDDLDLQEIIRELDASIAEPMEDEEPLHEYEEEEEDSASIDEIIESLLREEDEEEEENLTEEEEVKAELEDTKKELEEAYRTVKQMQSVIQEVNLLNAKLLYTNKLFRNFDLNDSQKMKVLENFDRAGNTREVKLVFSTLAESFKRPTKTTKKHIVKESYASKPVNTTAPRTQVLNEGFELADRWKKLAGLL